MTNVTKMMSRAQTADDDTRQFIRGLEMSARRVLTKANKRRMDELQRQQTQAKRMGRSDATDLPHKFVVEISPGAEEWRDQLTSKTLEIPSTGMTVSVRATQAPRRHASPDAGGKCGNGDGGSNMLPALGVADLRSADGIDTGRRRRHLGRALPIITRSVGSLTLGVPSQMNSPTGGRGDGHATSTAGFVAKIDGRLADSPFFSDSMVELTKPPSSAKVVGALAGDPLSTGGADDEAPGGIENMRVVSASKIIGVNGRSPPPSCGPKGKPKRAGRVGGASEIEAQGPTSWSSDDIRVKYRAEREREEAYQASQLQVQVAEALAQDYGQTVAVPEVDRHPLYVAYYAQLHLENSRCLLRASARNKMKRFITDVHTVWLTNLAHHPEHRGGGESGDTKSRAARSWRGLDDARDSKAIVALRSQIQSVRPERAFQNAVFFAGPDDRHPEQDHESGREDMTHYPGSVQNDSRAPRAGEITSGMSSSYVGVDPEGGAPPTLPDPPAPLPKLVVLASERTHLCPILAVSTTSSKRRSVGGTGSTGMSLPDSGKRMLRVLRFQATSSAAPRRPTSTLIDDTTRKTKSESEGFGSRKPYDVGSKDPGNTFSSSPNASWVISSYNPYDGSGSCLVLEDDAVRKTTATWLSRAGGTPSTGQRLVLRTGMRVPVLDHECRPNDSVPSVVEVFASSPPNTRGTMAAGVDGWGGGRRGLSRSDGEESAADRGDGETLEVVAYPLLSSRRSLGRQRIILTTESLWRRRPHKTFEKPPAGLGFWRVSYSPETGQGVPNEREDDAVGPVGNNGLNCISDKMREALDDILSMVAFGPRSPDADRPGACRALPLLLRPPLSFGSDCDSAIETSRAGTAGSGTTAILPGGIARLEDESTAEILLALARLADNRQGQGSTITVEGVDSSSIREVSQDTWLGALEEQADRLEPLSMRVCGRMAKNRVVPGTCNIGKMGVTFSYPQAVERTQAVAAFFRDGSVSSSDSVMVIVALALDTPRLSPLITAWEKEAAVPEAAPDETLVNIVPRIMISPGSVVREGVISEVGDRSVPNVMLLTDAEKEADYSVEALAAAINYNGKSTSSGTAAGMAKREIVEHGMNHRRNWPEVDEHGFRRYAVYHLIEPDAYLETLAFGITKRAALANIPGVCGRSIFHSGQRCTEQLCRQRDARDYSYVSSNDLHRGPSDPGSYSVSCKYNRMKLLSRTGLESYNAEMARVMAERERLAKEAALQAKIERGKAQLANRRAREDALARSLARKADVRTLKISTGAQRARRKWELRFDESHVVETRGSWEQRRDSGGSLFYHCNDEFVQERFSWDPPLEWDKLDCSSAGEQLVSINDASDPPGAEEHIDESGRVLADLESLGMVEPGTSAPGAAIPTFPRQYTQKEQLSMAVSRLAGNEKLLSALAWRLGIPRENITADGREPSLARGDGHDTDIDVDGAGGGDSMGEGGNEEGGLSANERVKDDRTEDEEEISENREQVELGEFDESFDSDCEREDKHESPGLLPQDHSDLRRMRVAERGRILKERERFGGKQPRYSCVPPLPLTGGEEHGRGVAALAPVGVPAMESLEAQLGGLGWRRLAGADVGRTFLEKVANTRTQGPRPDAVNTYPKPRPMEGADPTLASKRQGEFNVPLASMFIDDVVEEHARVLQEAERRMKQQEMIADDASGEFNFAQLANNGPQAFTSLERRLMALAESDDQTKDEVQEADARVKAVTAAKTGNLQDLETLLLEDVPPDTRDSNGNSLLILAAQQGNKRVMKFLLRKGATMNHQNMDGNTVLHFCYAHGRPDLGEYLKTKGADDSLINSQGLTCYEGLSAQLVEAI